MSIATETTSTVPSIPLYRLKEISHPSEIEGRRTFIELTEATMKADQAQAENERLKAELALLSNRTNLLSYKNQQPTTNG